METTPQRQRYLQASNVLYNALLFSVSISFFRSLELHSVLKHKQSLLAGAVGAALGLLLRIGLYYAIRLGQRWAVVVYASLMLLSLVVIISFHGRYIYTTRTGHLTLSTYLFLLSLSVDYGAIIWALLLINKKPTYPQALA